MEKESISVMITGIKNAKVVTPQGIIWDGVILIDGKRIINAGNAREIKIPDDAQIIDAEGAYVGPGFVDIHVHGGNGYMFDSDPVNAAKHFLSHGETTVLATLYYNLSKPEFLKSIDGILSVMKNEEIGAVIGGFYMEGPYMNPKFGASPELNKWKGEIKKEDFCQLCDRAGEAAKVWAIAPEREGIEPFMEYAKKVNPNVKFACGHSEATPQQIRKVAKYGVDIMTHCMDATGRTVEWDGTRGAGPDEYCLLNSDMYAELICDSMAIHVNRDLINLLIKVKGIDKIILITDSFVSDEASPEGLKHVTDLTFDANEGLSGSKLTMDRVCKNFMQNSNCGIAQAFIAASTNPAKAIGMDDEIGTIETGKKANLVFIDDMFNIKKVILEGKIQ